MLKMGWGRPAKGIQDDRDGKQVDSPRAGGRYFVSGTATTLLTGYNDWEKARLTDWLVEARRLGSSCPEISSGTVKDAVRRRAMTASERADNILRYLASMSKTLGYKIYISFDERVHLELLANSGSVDSDELQFLLTYLQDEKLIHCPPSDVNVNICTLTVKGHARLAELENVRISSSNAFVAMWFDKTMNEAYEKGVRPGIEEAGYQAVRIDRQEHNNRIDDEIIAEIRRSRFVVADFTHGDDGARGGVYYEAGFAHGLGIPVIFTCREDCLEKVHLDTRQYNHIVWDDPGQLRTAIRNRIRATVGEGPVKTGE